VAAIEVAAWGTSEAGVVGVGQEISGLKKTISSQQMAVDDPQCLIETANASILGIDIEGCVSAWN